MRGFFSLLTGMHEHNETCDSQSLPGPHEADHIFQVIGSKVKVIDDI